MSSLNSNRHQFDIDNRYNETLRAKAPKLNWLPWVGKEYAGQATNQRLLIVGESHYAWNNGIESARQVDRFLEDLEFTRYFIWDNGLHSKGASTKLPIAISRALCGRQPTPEQKTRLWSSVAYYNRIQRIMVNIKDRPSSHDYKVAWDTFFPVLSSLEPGYCLFAGLDILRYTDELQQAARDNGYTVCPTQWHEAIGRNRPRSIKVISPAGSETKLLFIKHPSKFFSWEKWGKFLDQEMPVFRERVLNIKD